MDEKFAGKNDLHGDCKTSYYLLFIGFKYSFDVIDRLKYSIERLDFQ